MLLLVVLRAAKQKMIPNLINEKLLKNYWNEEISDKGKQVLQLELKKWLQCQTEIQ